MKTLHWPLSDIVSIGFIYIHKKIISWDFVTFKSLSRWIPGSGCFFFSYQIVSSSKQGHSEYCHRGVFLLRGKVASAECHPDHPGKKIRICPLKLDGRGFDSLVKNKSKISNLALFYSVTHLIWIDYWENPVLSYLFKLTLQHYMPVRLLIFICCKCSWKEIDGCSSSVR